MKLQYIIFSSLISIASVVNAQTASQEELSKEITIEKEIIPEQRVATRLNVAPKVVLPAVKAKRLTYSDRSVATSVPVSIATLEPASYGDKLSSSYNRGYVDLGYFPMFNMGVSAGYRFFENENTRLNGWLQYDGAVYDGDNSVGDEITMRHHDITLGVNLKHKVNNLSTVNLGIDYTFGRFNVPIDAVDDYNQNINRVNIGTSWQSTVRGIDYSVGLRYGHFGYNNSGWGMGSLLMEPARENRFLVDAGAMMPIGMSSHTGVDLSISHLDYSSYNTTLFSITPFYDYVFGDFTTHIGAKIDISSHSGKSLHIAPDVALGWRNAESLLSGYIKFSGGEHQNTLGALYDFTRYAHPSGIYENSNIPFAVDAGITIGTWKGFSLEILGGYAVANDWLMPVDMMQGCCGFSQVNLKGWHFGVVATYEYRDLAKLKVGYETAPQKFNRGYYLWRDRARHVVDASLTVTPVKALDITLGYELRADRKIMNPANVESHAWNLGDVDNLSLGGLYRFTPQFSLFARLENMLNSKHMIIGDIPAQGFTGLVGFGYKF